MPAGFSQYVHVLLRKAEEAKEYKYMPQTDKFQGNLTERELGIIEDALETYEGELGDDLRANECRSLRLKLYKCFWEVK